MLSMNKKRQGNQQADRIPKYSIRRLKVGVASVTIAIGLFFSLGQSPTIQAQELMTAPTSTESSTTDEQLSSAREKETANKSVEDKVETPMIEQPFAPVESTHVTEANEQAEEVTTILTEASETTEQPTETQDKKQADQPSAIEGNQPFEATTPIEPQAVAAQSNAVEDPIPADHLRVHFESLPNDLSHAGLWLWGGVAQPSAEVGNWPDAAFSLANAKKSNQGYYIDIPAVPTGGDIHYLLLNNGEKVTENDQTITRITPTMNEVWINSAYQTSTYEPLADENKVRINYFRADGNYDDYVLWAWNDVTHSFKQWLSDAIPFTQEGSYGRYIDVDLSRGLDSAIGFLIVNKHHADDMRTGDLTFGDRKLHSQLFIRELEQKVYTNPYFVDTTQQVLPDEHEGKETITVQATVNRPFHYNEHGVVNITVSNPKNIGIRKVVADLTPLGGQKEYEISPELMKTTITATSDVQPGEYPITITVFDQNNGYYKTEVTVTVKPREKAVGELDWDEQVIYFMVTDRFYNGDKSNDNPYQLPYDQAKNKRGVYQGGDFKGVTAKLDYLQNLGVTTIWVTPIVQNIAFDASHGTTNGEYYAYHGYWAADFEKLNPHLGTLADFHELIDQAKARNMNIMVDVVLNHAGYGLNTEVAAQTPGAPSIQDRDRFAGMFRDKQGADDLTSSLAGLPDFKTEDPAVRQKLVEWQSNWLNLAKTKAGNSIYAYRVDTVKHVDHTTWQHFKNELVEKDGDFRLIGESWGADYKDTKGHLGNGMMDALLDFGFKSIARQLVNGDLKGASEQLMNRGQLLTSAATLGQFLSSHDEDGFLFNLKELKDRYLLAVTAQLTTKGQPVIYYGEELGQTGENNWPIYTNRYDFNWEKVEGNKTLDHYQRLLAFRKQKSELLARGDHQTVAGSNGQGWLVTKREYQSDKAYVAYNIQDTAQTIRVYLSNENAKVFDHYAQQEYSASVTDDGAYVDVTIPMVTQGGTLLLEVKGGELVSIQTPTVKTPDIAANHLRIHFETLPSGEKDQLGLWIWEDVAQPSDTVGKWPDGALSLSQAQQDDYGHFIDIPLANGKRNQVKYLFNNKQGQNLSPDQVIELISPTVNEVWIGKDYTVSYVKPLMKEGVVRIHYLKADQQYEHLGVWAWGDSVQTPGAKWPDGVDMDQVGPYGAFVDIALKDVDHSLGFLVVNERNDSEKTVDYKFNELSKYRQLFIREGDKNVYTNPFYINQVRLQSAELLGPNEIMVGFTTTETLTAEELLADLTVKNVQGQSLNINEVTIDTAKASALLKGDFAIENGPFTVSYRGMEQQTLLGWKLKDRLYAYDGKLGLDLADDHKTATITMWSPSAQQVALVLYDKADQNKIVNTVAMTKGEKGTWSVQLNAHSVNGDQDLRGYYYHFEIERNGKKVLALDPYAHSLAEWNSTEQQKVAKAAIIDLEKTGPALDFAQIPGFTKREDAIIYEAHVRDFTSDQRIHDSLKQPFGTFTAFIEKLDYLKDLGVTHVQLLPIMSYYHANETQRHMLENDFSSTNNNYNWGYDPQSYFALSGMYSSMPSDPAKRVEEFKQLVDAIHQRGMGVILDVVFNHTAQTHIFEDLEPNYYHFMNADGTPRESFGGGRLGTTHHMSRRILVDSIKHWVSQYKVDGFRFDMMGDHDAAAIQKAYDAAAKINPNIIMIGEGWRTFVGDATDPAVQAADQDWMKDTTAAGVFSDDIRNELKSGFGSEGQARFLTGGARNLHVIYNNIIGRPSNFIADQPGDVVQYIEAHDNLTLYDVIAQSIKKDPSVHDAEIHQRIRLGNTMILTAQGIAFIHSGQEYGRTKQFLHPDYATTVQDAPYKSTYMTDQNGRPFKFPYFIHDSYDSSDRINRFDWSKATNAAEYPRNVETQAYTAGLIQLRRSTDAFRLGDANVIQQNVQLITDPSQTNQVNQNDLMIAYQVTASNGDIYAVFVNADQNARMFTFGDRWAHLGKGQIIVDATHAGITPLSNPVGVRLNEQAIELDPLTATVILLKKESDTPNVTPPVVAEKEVYLDEQTKVSVRVSGEDTKRPLTLNVRVATLAVEPEEFKGKDYIAYEIYFTNPTGEREQITSPALVTLPKTANQTVDGIYYVLNTTGAIEKLPIEMVTNDEVRFEVTHFSYYAMLYKAVDSNQPGQDPNQPGQGSNQGPASGNAQQPSTPLDPQNSSQANAHVPQTTDQSLAKQQGPSMTQASHSDTNTTSLVNATASKQTTLPNTSTENISHLFSAAGLLFGAGMIIRKKDSSEHAADES